MKLKYLAYDNTGKQVAGTTEGPNVDDATEALRRKGLYVTEIGELAGPVQKGSARLTGRPGRTRMLKQLVGHWNARPGRAPGVTPSWT